MMTSSDEAYMPFNDDTIFIQHDNEIDQLYSKLDSKYAITPSEMDAEREWEEIYEYYLTAEYVEHRHVYMANTWTHPSAGEWYDEFCNFPTLSKTSFIERRALYLEDLSNYDKNPYEFEYIGRHIDITSLMMLDRVTKYSDSWYYYDCLCEFEKELSRKMDPEKWAEFDRMEAEEKKRDEEERKARKKFVTEIEPHFPEGVKRVNGELQAIDPESGIWYKTQEEFGFKPNLFVWVKEQGNSEVLTEYLENWKKSKPKLSFTRKRHQIRISNIIKGVCERHLYVLAHNIGIVYDIAFPVDKNGKQPVAYIEFNNLETVQKAIRLLDKMPLGRQIITVEEVIPKFSK
jgi:hypothetical protein